MGIEGARFVLPHCRGGARDLALAWIQVLESRDMERLDDLLTGDDEHAVEMRNIAVFLGVLSEGERQSVLDDVYRRREYES